MSDDISTTLHAAIQRAVGDLTEKMATEGLTALKQALDDAGVSEKLKQCEVFSHVAGDSVIFEIVVDSNKVMATDPKTMAAIREESSKLRQEMMKRVTKSFEMGQDGPRRVVRDARKSQSDARVSTRDARSSARDARHPALNARKGPSINRVIENPHGMDLTQDGKLSVTLERSTVTGKSGIKFPKNQFQGIMGDFMNRLNSAVSNNFADALKGIFSKHTT